jgi:hypothetical protein
MKRQRNLTKNKPKKISIVVREIACNCYLPIVLCELVETYLAYTNGTIFSAALYGSSGVLFNKILVAVKEMTWTPKLGVRYDMWTIQETKIINTCGFHQESHHEAIKPIEFVNHVAHARENTDCKIFGSNNFVFYYFEDCPSAKMLKIIN